MASYIFAKLQILPIFWPESSLGPHLNPEKKIQNFLSTEIEWLPLNIVNLSGENKDNMIKFLESLDDDEDVQNIFTNARFEN